MHRKIVGSEYSDLQMSADNVKTVGAGLVPAR